MGWFERTTFLSSNTQDFIEVQSMYAMYVIGKVEIPEL